VAAVIVVAPVQRAASTTKGVVVLVNPVLGRAPRTKAPTILPIRRVFISSRNTQLLLLIVLAIRFFPIQLNSPTDLAAEVVVVVVVAVVAEVVLVKEDGNTIVIAPQAGRKYLHFNPETDGFTPNLYQRLGQEDAPNLGW